MLELLITEDEILKKMTESIIKADSIGVYNGAYKVIELAVKGSMEER